MPLAGERVKASHADFPVTRARGTSATSIANNSYTSVNLQTEDFDDDGMHSTSVNTSRFTAQRDGRYLVAGGVGFSGNTTGRRGARIALNGASVEGTATLLIATSASAVAVSTRTAVVEMVVGDYVEVQAFQDSGGALNTSTTSEVQPSLMAEFRGTGS